MKVNTKFKLKIPPLKNQFNKLNLDKVKNTFQFLKVIPRFFARPKVQKFIMIFVISLGTALFLFETTLAVCIYGFKRNDTWIQYSTRIIPFPIAIVNFNVVTLADYNFEKNYINHFYDQAKKDIPAEMNLQIMDQLVENQILESQAPKYSVSVTSSDIDKTVNELIDQNGGEEEVTKVLDQYYGLKIKDFKKLVKSQLLRSKMSETVPAQLHASHILIKVDATADEKTVNDAKAKIDGVLNELKAGADFAEKAKNISDDTGSRDQGGDLGWFSYGDMVKPFEEAAFKLDLNQLSDPIRTDYGWHIIKVTEKKGSVKMSFDDWLKELKDKMVIKQLVNIK